MSILLPIRTQQLAAPNAVCAVRLAICSERYLQPPGGDLTEQGLVRANRRMRAVLVSGATDIIGRAL